MGVDYELQVSIENHAIDGFIFTTDPVAENENGNDEFPGQALTQGDFFTFFDAAVGNGDYPGGLINFLTPYARIQGGGNGSYDIYSFTITPGMLSPVAIRNDQPSAGSVPDTSGFFTSLTLEVTGNVKAGDRWELGLRYVTYEYEAQPGDDPADVARELGNRLPSRYAVEVEGARLTITDPNGFNLIGDTGSVGFRQTIDGAGLISRENTARDLAGQPVRFTQADAVFQGVLAPGDRVGLTVNGVPTDVEVGLNETAAAVLARLAQRLNQSAATELDNLTFAAEADRIRIVASGQTAFTLAGSIAGVAPQAEVAISGAPVAAVPGNVAFSSVRVDITGPVRPGNSGP